MSREDIKVADALVDDVFNILKRKFAGHIAFKTVGDLTDATGFTHWDLRELSKQLNVPEAKFQDHAEGLGKIEFLRGRIEALRANYGSSISHFEKAFELSPRKEFKALVAYYMGMTHGFWGKKDKAIEWFTRVKDMVGVDEEMGLQSAKEIEKLKASGGGGCFIATAACGFPGAPEVLLLQHFRDTCLVESWAGRFIVNTYGLLSPPPARLIARHPSLQRLAYHLLVRPAADLARLASQDPHEED